MLDPSVFSVDFWQMMHVSHPLSVCFHSLMRESSTQNVSRQIGLSPGAHMTESTPEIGRTVTVSLHHK